MPQPTLPGLPKPRPNIHRKVRVDHEEGDQILFTTKSFTKTDGTEWHPSLDKKTGEWHCDCPAARFHPRKPCKHALRAADLAEQTKIAEPGLKERLTHECCFRCFTMTNLFPMAHDDGTLAHDVFVC